jgi:hypothetical protein
MKLRPARRPLYLLLQKLPQVRWLYSGRPDQTPWLLLPLLLLAL